ncbi:MAG TPA: TIGR03435 family protein [Bryobacteraceae bacterium]|nr:TIGR03435 family protein [Bryobacteraceae bacterium]
MKSRLFVVLSALLAWACLLYGQGAGASFEVVSVRPSAALRRGESGRASFSGGPGTDDPTRFQCRRCTPVGLIMHAYQVQFYQILGPGWISMEDFDISANIPPNATAQQFRLMQEKLLSDRFKFVFHRESRAVAGFSLVAVKTGARLNRTKDVAGAQADGPESPPPLNDSPRYDKNGYPILPAGTTMMMHNDHMRLQLVGESMQEFAALLSNLTSRPVSNATDLHGKYDLSLSWVNRAGLSTSDNGINTSGASDEPEPTIFSALQQQLGLKLEPTKGPLPVIVIDRLERVPTEN